MKRSLVMGRSNAGKTLFCIQFARYLGVRDAEWLVERTDGTFERQRISLDTARQLWSGDGQRTRGLHSLMIELPRGKGVRSLWLTDTTGLREDIDESPDLRADMAQTLRAMLESQVILHVVDASAVGRALAEAGRDGAPTGAWGDLDEQLAAFGMAHAGYVLLANKMDLPEARAGLAYLRKRLDKRRVLPVSARCGTGFREVKQHVWRMA